MNARTIRSTSVTLPSLDEPGMYLSNVGSLEGGRGRVERFQFADAELRALDLTDVHLVDGRVTALKAGRARLEGVRVDSVEFVGCDLPTLRWSDSRLSRVVFRDCRLMGAVLEDVTLDDVLFDGCKLDYGTVTRLRAAGPVIFSKCSLRETTFSAAHLGTALFDGCDLALTEFDGGSYRGLDLRGNDLSRLRGVGSLRRIIVDRAQTLQLAEALAAELEFSYDGDGG